MRPPQDYFIYIFKVFLLILHTVLGTHKNIESDNKHGKNISTRKRRDSRMVMIMNDHTDRVEYHSDDTNDGWILTIRRDIPPLFITRR